VDSLPVKRILQFPRLGTQSINLRPGLDMTKAVSIIAKPGLCPLDQMSLTAQLLRTIRPTGQSGALQFHWREFPFDTHGSLVKTRFEDRNALMALQGRLGIREYTLQPVQPGSLLEREVREGGIEGDIIDLLPKMAPTVIARYFENISPALRTWLIPQLPNETLALLLKEAPSLI
jgi:hypothetical protein